MIPEDIKKELKTLCDEFFKVNHTDFDMAHASECGRYMEVLIPFVQNSGYDQVGHLRKNPGQTQYNGHAIDALAYDLGGNLTHAVDCIARAEQPHPWKSEGGTNEDPGPNFSEDTTPYKTDKDWLEKPQGGPVPDTVPYVGYQGDASNAELKRTLAFDYARRPQGADWDVSVWAFRVQHSAVMGPVPPSQGGAPLGMSGAVIKHRSEWCGALGVPVIPIPPGWNIGDPV